MSNWIGKGLVAIAVLPFWPALAAAQPVDQPPAPTLPDVIVEPPLDVPPPQPSIAEDFDAEPYDLSGTYPGLSDQLLEGLASGVRAERSVFDDPRSISIVGPQQLDERAPIDIGEALEGTLGVLIQRTGRGQASPFIRGLTGQQVLILVDGVRLTNATFRAGPNQYLNTIDPGQVERIEVIRGPASLLYGSDAIGGAINIVTREARRTTFDYLTPGMIHRASTADRGYYGRVNVEGWVGHSGVFSGAGYGNFNNVDVGGNSGPQPATSYSQYSGDLKFTQELDALSELVVALQHFEQNDLFRSDRFPAGRETIFDPQQRDLAYLRWQGLGGGNWIDRYMITGSFQLTKEDRLDRNPIDSPLQDQRQFTNEQFGLNLLFGTDLACCLGRELGYLNYGFDWYHEEIDARRQRVDESTVPPTFTTRTDTQFPNDSFYSRYGAYLEWDIPLTSRLRAISGVRYELITAGGTLTIEDEMDNEITGFISPVYDDWVFSVGLTYELSPSWHLVGSVREGFRAPNLEDLVSTNDNVFRGVEIPNPSLRPEHSINYEIGLKADMPRVRAETYVFWNDLQNNILRRPVEDPDFVLERENRDSLVQGVEFAGELLLERGWSIWGNFWYTYGQDLVEDEPLSRIPPMQGYLGLRWRSEGGGDWFEMYTWLVDRQDRLSARDRADTIRIPPGGTPGYATLNFRYGRRLGRHHRVALNLDNVTNQPYRVHGSGVAGTGIDLRVTYELLQ